MMALNVAKEPFTRARRSIGERLASVDWDFPKRVTHSEIEGVHPYPAKFIAEIPRALLEILPIPRGTAVFDPFCGSGAVLVESQRRGLPSVGIDLNPIACLMTRVKTSPRPRGLKEAASEVAARATERIHVAEIPDLPNIDHWFSGGVQRALAALRESIAAIPPEYRDALRLALSSIIVRVSNQESDTRYVAVENDCTAERVFSEFLKASKRVSAALSGRDYPMTPSDVFESDTLSFDAGRIGRRVGAVITSPPYPNAYEYWLYHKYRMYWLGFDPISVKKREIGARAHFFKRNHHTPDHFIGQMSRAFALINGVLVEGGHVCFVVGRSRIHGRVVDNARIVEEVAGNAGFERVFSAERALLSKRKSFNLSYANIKTESLIVFRRGAPPCA